MTKAERAAKAAVRELEARLVAHKAKKDAELLRVAKARKALDRYRATATVKRDGYSVELTDLIKVRASYFEARSIERKDLPAKIVDGTVKLEYGPGVSRGVKSLAKILRVTDRVDARALARLDRRIDNLQGERDRLIEAMHERGTPMSVEAIADHAAKLYTASANATSNYDRAGGYDYELTSIERDLQRANTHLQFIQGAIEGVTPDPEKPDEKACPCADCVVDRRDAAARAKEEARIAQLPRVKVEKCDCGRAPHLSRLGHTNIRVDDELSAKIGIPPGEYERFPMVRCPTDKKWRYFVSRWLEVEGPRQAKERERELRKNGVDWTCPTCGEDQRTIPHDDYNGIWVGCGACGEGTMLRDANPKALIRYERRLARKEAEQDAA